MSIGDFSLREFNPWESTWGHAYVDRNHSEAHVANDAAFFRRALRGIEIRSAIELGAGTGLALSGLRVVYPGIPVHGVELNKYAARILAQRIPDAEVTVEAVERFGPKKRYDLALTKNFLIHVWPHNLPVVYDLLDSCADRYVLMAEYYSPSPTVVPYRGRELWKRDFAGEFLEGKPFELVDYGFIYHRDPFPQDDLTWFLLRRLRS